MEQWQESMGYSRAPDSDLVTNVYLKKNMVGNGQLKCVYKSQRGGLRRGGHTYTEFPNCTLADRYSDSGTMFQTGFQKLAALSSSGGSGPNSSSSIQALFNSSSQASHSVNRSVAKLAVDVMGMSNGAKVSTVKGETYVTLRSELGDSKYKQLCSDAGLSLLTINYCQRGLSALGDASTWPSIVKLSKDPASPSTPSQTLQSQAPAAEDIKTLKGLINHDYLVLEIKPGDPSQPIFYIVAQKQSGDKPGIYITHLSTEKKGDMLHSGVVHYSIQCQKQLHLKSIIEILKGSSANYNLRNENCWDYATSTAKRLLGECAHVSEITPEETIRLEREQNDLEAHLNSRSIRSTFKILSEKPLGFLKSI